MSNIPLVNPETTTGHHKELFDGVKNVFGMVPNMFKAIGNSPAALESMFGSFGALGKGKIDALLSEQVAVYVADLNNCEYCLSAHTMLGRKAGATADEMAQAQAGISANARTQAALTFAGKVIEKRAHVTPDDVDALRHAGFGDDEVAELVAHIALNIFTNYTNVALDVPVDFPKIRLTSISHAA